MIERLEYVDLPTRTPLYEVETTPRYVHFLTSGIASMVAVLAGGDIVEVTVVGHEGFPEKIHLLGPQVGMTQCFMQVAGGGFRMPFRHFEQIFAQDAALHRTVLRLVQSEFITLSQLSACNRLHEVEERLARWLLMVQDRTGEPDVRLTQEFLAEMLGARRSTVNLAAGSLHRAGVIEYRRSHIRIQDRARLEDVACECYPIIHRLFEDLYKDIPSA